MTALYYIYEHWRPDTGVCFYVGKGRGNRAFALKGRNKYHGHIIEKLKKLGMKREVKIIKSDLTEADAFALEVERIAFWRSEGIVLVNMTNGGEGASGHIKTEEHLQKLRGRLVSAETRAKIAAIHRGRKFSDEHRQKLSLVSKNRQYSPETRAKLAAAKKGRKQSQTAIENHAASLRGRKHSPEQIEKARVALIAALKQRKEIKRFRQFPDSLCSGEYSGFC